MIENTASSQSINQFKTINDKLSSNFDISLITFLANKSKYIIALFFVVVILFSSVKYIFMKHYYQSVQFLYSVHWSGLLVSFSCIEPTRKQRTH